MQIPPSLPHDLPNDSSASRFFMPFNRDTHTCSSSSVMLYCVFLCLDQRLGIPRLMPISGCASREFLRRGLFSGVTSRQKTSDRLCELLINFSRGQPSSSLTRCTKTHGLVHAICRCALLARTVTACCSALHARTMERSSYTLGDFQILNIFPCTKNLCVYIDFR